MRYSAAMVKAVCFDLDGTLARYTGDFQGLMALLRSELMLQMCDMNSFGAALQAELAHEGALRLEDALARVLERFEQRPPPDLARIAEGAARAYAEEIRTYPGAQALLERLDRAGVKLALLSNGPDDMQKAALNATGLARYFRVVLVSGDRDVAARKPAPRIFSLACAGLQTVPEETLMVGDNAVADVGGALEYGLQAVLIAHPDHAEPVTAPAGVPLVRSLGELDDMLQARVRV